MNATMKALLVASFMMVAMPLLAAEKLYKWVDAEGNVHFSDRPPDQSAQQAEEIELDVEISAERIREARQRSQASQTRISERQLANMKKAERQAEVGKLRERQLAENQVRCAQARSNLMTFERPGPAYSINDNGEREFVDDANREQKIAQSRRAVSQYCSKG